jgi:hypothetical protein
MEQVYNLDTVNGTLQGVTNALNAALQKVLADID